MFKQIWDFVTRPRVEGITGSTFRRKVVIAHRLNLLVLAITFGYVVYYYIIHEPSLIKLILWDFASYFTCLILLQKGFHNLSRNLFPTLLSVNIFFATQLIGAEAGEQFLFFPIAAGAFIYFDSSESKRQIIFSLFPIILLGFVGHIEIPWVTPASFSKETLLTFNRSNLILSILITVYCVYYAMRLFIKTSEKVEEQKANLVSLIEHMGDSIWQINDSYELVYQNSAFKRGVKLQTGKEFEVGQNIIEESTEYNNTHHAKENIWKAYFDRALKGETFSIEQSFGTEGNYEHREFSFGPVSTNGIITGVVANSKDITARKEQEKKLQKSVDENRSLALVASTTPYAVIITDAESKIEWINPGFEKISGYKLPEIEGIKITEILNGPLTNEQLRNDLESKFNLKRPFSFELIHYKKNREPFWHNINVSPLFNESNELIKYIIIGQDISDRKKADEQLQMLLQHSQKLNKQLQARDQELQTSIRELNKQSWELQLSEEKMRKQKSELERMNNELTSKASQLSAQYDVMNVKNEELEKAKITLAQKADQLEQSNRYKTEFLANMSHELRTPLNSIIILSRLLMENKDKNLSDKQREFSKIVNKSGTDLLTLINDILDLSKIESGKFEIDSQEFLIKDLAIDLEGMFREVANEKEINFKINNQLNSDFILNSDNHRISQILKNLLSNAFKFTSKKGDILLDISCKEKDIITFTVKDNGIGIPIEKQQLIFESFKQVDGSTSRKYGGTGLGLSISRELSSLLGGKIILSSKPGEGSAFSLNLPLSVEENIQRTNPVKKEKNETNAISNLQSEFANVLIISGNKNDNAIIKALNNDKITSIKCLTQEKAVSIISENKIQCIILELQDDNSLPGIEILKAVKEKSTVKEIPVIVFTWNELGFKEKMMLGDYASIYIRKSGNDFNNLVEETKFLISIIDEEEVDHSNNESKE